MPFSYLFGPLKRLSMHREGEPAYTREEELRALVWAAVHLYSVRFKGVSRGVFSEDIFLAAVKVRYDLPSSPGRAWARSVLHSISWAEYLGGGNWRVAG